MKSDMILDRFNLPFIFKMFYAYSGIKELLANSQFLCMLALVFVNIHCVRCFALTVDVFSSVLSRNPHFD